MRYPARGREHRQKVHAERCAGRRQRRQVGRKHADAYGGRGQPEVGGDLHGLIVLEEKRMAEAGEKERLKQAKRTAEAL